jgi:hypothetical protein
MSRVVLRANKGGSMLRKKLSRRFEPRYGVSMTAIDIEAKLLAKSKITRFWRRLIWKQNGPNCTPTASIAGNTCSFRSSDCQSETSAHCMPFRKDDQKMTARFSAKKWELRIKLLR